LLATNLPSPTLLIKGEKYETTAPCAILSTCRILPHCCYCPVSAKQAKSRPKFLGSAEDNAKEPIDQGRRTFRFDTYATRPSGLISYKCSNQLEA
jgi:hypothetical protein